MQISKRTLGAALTSAACLLSACGGPNSSADDGVRAFQAMVGAAGASDKITITSRPVVSLYEGSTAVFYTATASDSAGKTVTFTLSGTDAAKFNLNSATGALSFKTAPSYTAPTDASGDNNYLVTLTGSDGVTSASHGLSVLVAQNIPKRAYSWGNAPFGGGGYISGLVYHPTSKNLLYARTDVGGAYRWNASTSTWTALNDSLGPADSQLLGVLSLAVDPQNPNLLYLATGQYVATWAEDAAILKSTDQGVTWTRSNLPFDLAGNGDGRETGERLQVDPNNSNILYLGTTQNGLWKSTNAGVTWAQVTAFTPISTTLVEFDKRTVSGGKSSIIYVGVNTTSGTSLYRSSDGGVTWGAISGEPTGLIPHHAKFDSNGVLYVSYGNALGPNSVTNGAVYKLTTSSGTWTNITPAAPGGITFGYSGLAVDAEKPGVVEVATMDRWATGDDIYRSTNGGSSWTAMNASSTHSNNGYAWLTAYSGGSLNSMGFWIGAFDIDPFNSNNSVYGTGFGLYMTANQTAIDTGGKIAWSFNVNGIEEVVPQALKSPPSGAHLYAAFGDVGGSTYSTFNLTDTSGYFAPPTATNRSVDYAETSPATVVRTSDGATTQGYLSTDTGAAWTTLGSTPVTSGNISGQIAMSPRATSMVWVPGSQGAYYSTNSGASWTASTGYPTVANSQYYPISDRFADGYYYVYDSANGVVYQSTNGGASFAADISGLPVNGGLPVSMPWWRGDLWIPTPSGLVHADATKGTFTTLTNVQVAYTVALGAPAPAATYPSIFIFGQVNGVMGVYRSDDIGVSWTQVNDSAHQYGWIGAISGDPRVWGRVYLGTSGRGTIIGNR